jgi:hypothetical protein
VSPAFAASARRWALLFAALVVVSLVAFAPAAAATTYTVNTPADNDITGPTDCSGTPGGCSLRQATAKAAGTGNTVSVPSGTYTLTLGDLDVAGPMTISGAGARTTTVNRTSIAKRIFFIEGSGTVSVTGLTVSGGDSSGDPFAPCNGGGLYVNTGVTLALTDATVGNNLADCPAGGAGGAIWVGGTLTLANTTLTGNEADQCLGTGGALYTFGGTITATNSTISGNHSSCPAGADGAGITAVGGSSSVTLRNVTLAGNILDETTSGTGAAANLELDPSGGNSAPTISIRNTIIAYPGPAADGNCRWFGTGSAPPTSVGHNISDDATCGFTATGDQQNVNPLLGTLANNGGQTDTLALGAGGPAIDAGDNTGCPATDQRGVMRPQDGNGDGTATCDVGAFELAAASGSGGGAGGPGVPGPTGQRAAALASCKRRAHKHDWSHKRLRKCKRKANLLPV